MITVSGGLRPEINYPNVETVPPLQENPTTSYEKFRVVWRTFVEDPTFEKYARSRMPTSLKDMKGYDPKYTFSKESSGYSPFLYDAITGLGLALCRAANNITEGQTFGGEEVYKQFASLSFDGASGNVTILPDTGTRDYTTELFTLFNAQPYEDVSSGNQTYKLVPTNYYKNGWKAIDERVYVYANGGTVTPDSLPPPDLQMNYISSTGRAVGYTLMALVALGSFAAFGWLFWYRREPVVRASQALFLSMIAFGSLVMASSIVPLSFEEPMPESSLDAACMAAPWLYVSGAVIVVSALLTKTRAIRHVRFCCLRLEVLRSSFVANYLHFSLSMQTYMHPEVDFVQVTPVSIFGTFAVLYLINFIVMLSWQLVAPLQWIRVYLDSKDVFDRFVDSYGLCSSDNALPFVIVIVILNISILLVGNWWAYQARNIETEYGESRYIGISMASILQAWCMGIPILIVVWDNPQAKFFVEAGIIFVTALAVLLLVFIPKSFAIRADRIKAAEENKRLAYSSFTNRARKSNAFPEEQNPTFAALNDVSNGNIDFSTEPSEQTGEKTAPREPQTPEEADVPPEIPPEEHHDEATALASTNGSRRRMSRRSLLDSLSKSFRLSTVNGESAVDNNSESMRGIRVIHNPRVSRPGSNCLTDCMFVFASSLF
jgi:7 transmembrane sweet-taste receptor of 3 GCPR